MLVPRCETHFNYLLYKDETVQVQSATKVCEESEVGTNIQVYEI